MSTTTNAAADWVGGTRTKLVAWWLPHAALIAGLLVAVPARTAIWIVALAWMGVRGAAVGHTAGSPGRIISL